MKIAGKIIIPLLLLAPAKLLACAACYGANIDAPMAEGMNWAIFTLGAFITTVLGGFLTFLVYAIRKSEKVEAARQRAAAEAAADESAAPFPITPNRNPPEDGGTSTSPRPSPHLPPCPWQTRRGRNAPSVLANSVLGSSGTQRADLTVITQSRIEEPA